MPMKTFNALAPIAAVLLIVGWTADVPSPFTILGTVTLLLGLIIRLNSRPRVKQGAGMLGTINFRHGLGELTMIKIGNDIKISNDMKTAELSEGSTLYTQDGQEFRLVKDGQILAIFRPGNMTDACLSVATFEEVPQGTKPLSGPKILLEGALSPRTQGDEWALKA